MKSYTDIVIAVTILIILVLALYVIHGRGIEKINKKMQKVIFKLFGIPSYREVFLFKEAKDWIKSRSELIEGGYKATILNFIAGSRPAIDVLVNGAGFSEKQVKIFSKTQKYIVVAIVNDAYSHDDSRYIKDCVLVKYAKLDDTLAQILKKGNGILVVNGNVKE